MSTAFYNPNETSVTSAGMVFNPDITNTGAKAASVLVSQLSSRSNPSNGNSTCRDYQVSDDDLVTAAQGGDEHAFAELCKRYSCLTKKKIFGIVQNQEDAEDVMQDTLLRAYTHLASFRRSCKFSTWITSIGVNSALMLLRKRRVRRETQPDVGISSSGEPEVWEPVDRSPGPDSLYQRRQTILVIGREIQKLRPRLRSIVDLYYKSERSLEELAESLDISVAAAKSRLMRGRVTLRSKLARHGISNSST